MALPVLYEIAKDYKDALEELSDLEDEAVLDTLEGLKGTLEAKSENIIKYTQNLNGTIKAMKEAEKNMAERRKRLEKKTENIKKYVKSVMEENQITKIETEGPHLHFEPRQALPTTENPLPALRSWHQWEQVHQALNAIAQHFQQLGTCYLLLELHMLVSWLQ